MIPSLVRALLLLLQLHEHGPADAFCDIRGGSPMSSTARRPLPPASSSGARTGGAASPSPLRENAAASAGDATAAAAADAAPAATYERIEGVSSPALEKYDTFLLDMWGGEWFVAWEAGGVGGHTWSRVTCHLSLGLHLDCRLLVASNRHSGLRWAVAVATEALISASDRLLRPLPDA